MTRPTLLVFSHLRWNFVYQRPQHLLSRMAWHFDILFVEEPVWREGKPSFEVETPVAGIEVLRPNTVLSSWGFSDEQMALIAPLLHEALSERGVARPLVWFYTPMALPLLRGINARAVFYDCMDELSAFKGAPPELHMRETELLAVADSVFTGGPSLFEAKRGRAANVHCMPSSVDAAHFAPLPSHVASSDIHSGQAQAVQGHIPQPRLGYFGVIDERMDIPLIEAVADHDPLWQVVMVGPVVKIDAARLPQRPNLHWLGQQPYSLLPRLVAGWQVCLLPFALNESTAFISPTKTLEYLAAGKPVVSTAVRDVGVLYGEGVAIAGDAQAFVAACASALCEAPAERNARLAAGASLVTAGSWDHTTDRMLDVMQSVLQATARRSVAKRAFETSEQSAA